MGKEIPKKPPLNVEGVCFKNRSGRGVVLCFQLASLLTPMIAKVILDIPVPLLFLSKMVETLSYQLQVPFARSVEMSYTRVDPNGSLEEE